MKLSSMIAALVALGVSLGATSAPAFAMPAPVAVSVPNPTIPILHRRGFHVHGGVYYYHGHRGFLRPRPGYRYYNGYWFPAAAFAAGAAAGAAAAASPRIDMPAAHVRWCYDRYRSYRAYDNTYQPYDGPRRQCWSPYS